jgi:SSS family solute:Na+ symporter
VHPLLPFATFVPRRLGGLDYLLIALYFGANLGIGAWCARRRQSTSNDFFLGGGRISWWAASISYFATVTSSISFMALPAATFTGDWTVFGSSPAQSLAGILVGFAFVSILRRLDLTTVFGYLDRRFDRRVRLLGAGLAVLLKVGGRMSVVLLLPSLALSTVTGLNVYASIVAMGLVTTLYALKGGFEAVIWTDVLQAGVMVGGMILAISRLAAHVDGGLAGIVHLGAAAGKFRVARWDWDFSGPTVWVFVGMFLASIFTYVADQPLMQRVFAAANERDARRTVLLGNSLSLGVSLLFFFLGSSLFVFYHLHPERLDPALPNDAIFPYFIANEMPPGIVGIIVAALFAASMGALSSTINATAAIVVSDFQGALAPQATEAAQARLARVATVVAGLLATGLACYIASLGVPSLWDQFLKLVALIGGGFPGVFALGLLTRRATSEGVIVGALASIAVTGWLQACTHTSSFFHGFVAISSCMIIGYLSSLVWGRPRSAASLRGLVVWDLKSLSPAPSARG